MSEQNSQNFQQTKWFLSSGVSLKVLGPGGDHISGLDWDNSAVGVGDESSEANVGGDDAVVVGVRVAGSVGVGTEGMVDGTAGGSVGNLGSVHLRGVNGNNGTVGVTHQLGGGDGHAGRENLRKKILISECF